jgi:putative endonuclease
MDGGHRLMQIFVYTLQCGDGSYYVGSARGDLDYRIAEHNIGALGGYTASRRPVELVWHQEFEAVSAERQIKGWSRKKKEALIAGDFEQLTWLAKRPSVRGKADNA